MIALEFDHSVLAAKNEIATSFFERFERNTKPGLSLYFRGAAVFYFIVDKISFPINLVRKCLPWRFLPVVGIVKLSTAA